MNVSLSTVHVLAAGQSGTPIWVTPVIAGAAAILAATVTYTDSVYMPLAISVHEIQSEFLSYKGQIAAATADQSNEDAFRKASDEFIMATDSLFRRGGGAVLTIRLDEAVTRFGSFLRGNL